MTRIIAGSWGGRRLQTPRGDGTRPTSDRVRESMFSSIGAHLDGFDPRLRVLDLFAGSGALALEALSRGAGSAELVEADARAAAVARRNVDDLGAPAVVVRTTAEKYVRRSPSSPFGLVFLDPPYALPTADVADLVAALRAGATTPDALFVVERSTRDPFAWPDGVEALWDRSYGETTLWYGR